MTQKKLILVLLSLLLLLGLSCALSLFMGPAGWSNPGFFAPDASAIVHYRLSRIILAIVAGSSLAASGASLQAIFRNPLADPHLFGISGGAALGACIVIGFFSEHLLIMPSAGAIVGGVVAFVVIFFYMQTAHHGPIHHCLLVGVLINSLAASLITVLKTTLPPTKTQSLLFWLVGHLTVVETTNFFLIIPLWLLGMAMLAMIKGELELLSFGFDESRLLGINADRVAKIAVAANCILIGNVVAFAGMIGFLGLVIPHIVRLMISANLRVMLPIASVMGAIFLVFFDALSRLSFVFFKSEIPVGAMSALFLSPVFFLLLVRGEQYESSIDA